MNVITNNAAVFAAKFYGLSNPVEAAHISYLAGYRAAECDTPNKGLKCRNKNNLFYCIIKVFTHNKVVVRTLKWENLTWENRVKFDSFFRVQAAKLQLQYPDFVVHKTSGEVSIYQGTSDKVLKIKVICKMAKITRQKNNLKRFAKNFTSKEEAKQQPFYIKTTALIEQLERELKVLQDQA